MKFFTDRTAGILLHPTSLPGIYGIGDLGPSAYRFVDFLKASGQTYWQVLPLVVPDIVGSPYASSSAFAGNWLLVSPELLVGRGLLPNAVRPWSAEDAPVHVRDVVRRKRAVLIEAYRHFTSHGTATRRERFRAYCVRERYWLDDYALFAALKDHFGDEVPWTRWPHAIRRRDRKTVARYRARFRYEAGYHAFVQWVFDEQWASLRRYARSRGVHLIGDLPLFVTRDSADTWAKPSHFLLDRLGRPTLVAGVPPDYFSSRGQVWGDPLYDWPRLRADGFRWWLERFRRSFAWYDIVRLDHFRGYAAVWGVRAGSRSSRRGSWRAVPGRELFTRVIRKYPHARFIAEDLGVITQDVVNLRNELGFPGVRVLQFGFDDLGSVHALSNISRRSVLYTGTHDNNTTRGWFGEDAQRHERRNILKYFHATERTVAWHMVRAAYRSRANTVIVPLQDMFNLGSTARMNTPGTRKGNWKWRFDEKLLTKKLAQRVQVLTKATKR